MRHTARMPYKRGDGRVVDSEVTLDIDLDRVVTTLFRKASRNAGMRSAVMERAVRLSIKPIHPEEQ